MASLILSITALLVSVTTLLVMLYISRNEGRWSFFTEYTDRYSSIMKEISEAVLRDVEVQALDVAPIRRYFDLCSEEYYLHITHMLPHKVWQYWFTGIRGTMRDRNFRRVWADEAIRNTYNDDFKHFMDDVCYITGQKH